MTFPARFPRKKRQIRQSTASDSRLPFKQRTLNESRDAPLEIPKLSLRTVTLPGALSSALDHATRLDYGMRTSEETEMRVGTFSA